MPKKSRDTVTREVNDRIDGVVRDNRRLERLIAGVVVAQAAVGLGLVVAGAFLGRWEVAAPGGGLAVLLIWPIKVLISIKDDNNRLRLLPELLRLAEEAESKRLAAEHVERMIGRMGQP